MTVADYVLATLCVVLCLVWGGFSWLVACIDAFVPAPDGESAKIGRTGCASLLGAMLSCAFFVGAIWNGDWGWLS